MEQELFRQKYEAALDYRVDDDYNEETFRELMKLARLELPAYAEKVLRTDQKKLYSDFASDLENSQWFEESFPTTNFSLILDVICDPRFLKTRKGWSLLMIFELEWNKVTEQQRVILLDTFVKTYDKFDDWMACFVISELIGEKFDPSQAYKFFKHFAKSPKETARAFVPHGFEHALRNSPEAKLMAKLWIALLDMERDESSKVRGEVETTLHRLANHGLQRP